MSELLVNEIEKSIKKKQRVALPLFLPVGRIVGMLVLKSDIHCIVF